MTRIAPVSAEDMTPEQKRISDMIFRQRGAPVRGPFAVLLRTPELADLFANFVDRSLSEDMSRIPLRLKELAIIVVARAWSANYEWFIHAPRAIRYGIDERAVEDIRRRRTPAHLEEDEALVYDLVREIVETRGLSEASYAAALDCFGEEGMVEFAVLVGFYHTVSLVLNVFDVEAPEGRPRPLQD